MKLIRQKQYNIYGSSAAAQLKLSKILDDSGTGSKTEGWHLFVEAAKVKPDAAGQSFRSYDWDNKIILKLGIPDIGVFLNGYRLGFDETKLPGYNPTAPKNKKFDIYHDPGKGGPNEGKISKGMAISKGREYGFMISMRETEGGKTNSITIPISDEQMCVLKLLLEESVKMITGFFDTSKPLIEEV